VDVDDVKQDTEKQDVVINIRHLKKSFGGNNVLRDINIDLHKGESLAIIGRSGQGKSVTVKCIVGLMDYDDGTVNVLGKEVKDSNEDDLKKIRIKVGFLFQGGALYDSMNVYDNLAFPLSRVLKIKDKNEIDRRIEEILADVGLENTAKKMPAALSGGMRKRIALARTLILGPEIMLYDEPTTGLDPITSEEISTLIVNMQRQRKTSSLIITHDMPCAQKTANRMLVMDNGIFIAEGTYNELEKSGNQLVRSFFK
jgi:phospholipid/cholesterol/gamma-HCH transport system ATP-binding protein